MSPTLTDANQVVADPSDGIAALERRGSLAETFGIPLAVLAELTHRCPLQCPYCSNPIELERGAAELTTAEWKKVLSELAEIGVLQIHFSGGEPTARKDLVELVQHATDVGLYSNLITSAVLLTREKLAALAEAGLCHVQISFQGSEPVVADRVAGFKDAHAKKLDAAKWTRELDLPLTVNAVMHRQNLFQLPDIIQMAVDLDADRLEVANVQYYGWALKNRAALMPTLEQIEATSRIVEDSQVRLKGILAIDYVVPDYYALRPKKCMGGWGRQFFNISPAGKILPCHAAESRDHHRVGIRIGAVQSFDRLDLAELGSLQPLSRHRLDAGAVRKLRFQGDRFWRLPLPGLRADGRCRQYRSGLRAVAAARTDFQTRRAGSVRRQQPFRLPQFCRRRAGDGRRPWRLTLTRQNP
jgi:pyrroloquinoline quinone biosynthesis protein E